MSFQPQVTFDEGGGATPHEITLAPGQNIRVYSIRALWDGAGAGGSFLAVCTLKAQDGTVLARTRPEQQFAAGDSGDVTYAPFLHSNPAAAPVVPGSLPYSVLELTGEFNIWRVLQGVPTRITPYTSPPPFQTQDMQSPRLSPDQAWILYRDPDPDTGDDRLQLVPGSGGSVTTVLDFPSDFVMHPSWHPDSDQIVLCRGLSGAFRGQVEKTDRAGAGPTVLYTPAATDGAFRAQFNRDGTTVSFLLDSNAGAGIGLYVMGADGSSPTQIATIGSYLFNGPQHGWSPTEDRIVFATDDTTVKTIMADGTGLTTINVGEAAGQTCRVSDACFAPDGSYALVASRHFDGSGFVWLPYRMELDGSGVTRLNDTHGPYDAANFQCVYRSLVDDRLYFIDQATTSFFPGRVSSLALDGTDFRVEQALDTDSVGDYFYPGSGFDFV